VKTSSFPSFDLTQVFYGIVFVNGPDMLGKPFGQCMAALFMRTLNQLDHNNYFCSECQCSSRSHLADGIGNTLFIAVLVPFRRFRSW
jgi:hypothetical protein